MMRLLNVYTVTAQGIHNEYALDVAASSVIEAIDIARQAVSANDSLRKKEARFGLQPCDVLRIVNRGPVYIDPLRLG